MPLAAGKNKIIILSFLDFGYLLDNFYSSHTFMLLQSKHLMLKTWSVEDERTGDLSSPDLGFGMTT